MSKDFNKCMCGSGQDKYALYDGMGIFAAYVCDECVDSKQKGFRSDIMDKPYTQNDVDEPIDPPY